MDGPAEHPPDNGAQALLHTLVASGVDVCFGNPGTSEMHFVAALDTVPAMRCILGLFEGAVTGAADGYGRMAGRPAATLLHLGPGLGNGLANLHNAMRARTPIVNVIGDHASDHKRYDAPLESDIEGYARVVSHWLRVCRGSAHAAQDAADAVAAAMDPPGAIASLILPADASWGAAKRVAAPVPLRPPRTVAPAQVEAIAKVLRSGEPCALLLGGRALRRQPLEAAARVAQATSAKLLCETFPARQERGAGLVAVERLAYLAEMAIPQLQGIKHLILVDSKAPVSFFAYPDKPSTLWPEDAEVHPLASFDGDVQAALSDLADAVAGHVPTAAVARLCRPDPATGPINAETLARTLGRLLPEGAIISDEANTVGAFASFFTAGAPPHDWLCLTGGAIGQGIPVATGAAVACPDRKVINLQADGSAMYTLQGLWTQAREGLDVTTIILNNRAYGILNLELSRVGAGEPGPKARAMLDLSGPPLSFTALAEGLGVPASRVDTAEQLHDQLQQALSEEGPRVIEAIVG